MKAVLRYAVPIAFALSIFAILRFFFPTGAEPDMRKLSCIFRVETGASSVTIPYSAREISVVAFDAELSGKSVHEDVNLWSARGVATFEGTSQELTGPVFLRPDGKVRGLSLYRDRYPRQAVDLRISTLNNDGKLDWNEHSAFVYFEGGRSKMSHPYTYRCDVTNGS